jgi:hypothetical protein
MCSALRERKGGGSERESERDRERGREGEGQRGGEGEREGPVSAPLVRAHDARGMSLV